MLQFSSAQLTDLWFSEEDASSFWKAGLLKDVTPPELKHLTNTCEKHFPYVKRQLFLANQHRILNTTGKTVVEGITNYSPEILHEENLQLSKSDGSWARQREYSLSFLPPAPRCLRSSSAALNTASFREGARTEGRVRLGRQARGKLCQSAPALTTGLWWATGTAVSK